MVSSAMMFHEISNLLQHGTSGFKCTANLSAAL